MAEWLRDTPWRQGHLLAKDSMQRLLPDAVRGGNDVAVVISHDCDLAQPPEVEPTVELILGRQVEKLNGNYSHAKSARRLHLSFSGGDVARFIDTTATQKVTVPKAQLAEHGPDGSTRLTADEQAILQRWLAARYSRSAFPDEFDSHLAEAGIPDGLAKVLKPLNSVIVAMYFDVDKGVERDHKGEGDPYGLFVYLLYTERHDADGGKKAEEAVARIRQLFRDRFFNGAARSWKNIELEGCEAVSDETMTYAQLAVLKKWNGDYISLRANPQQQVAE